MNSTKVFKDCSNLPHPPARIAGKKEGSLHVVIFFGVSCMGKTTFSKLLSQGCRDSNSQYLWTSFDSCGEPILEEYKKNHPECTDPEAVFIACWGDILERFHKDIFHTISHELKPGKNVVVIDDAKLDPKVLAKLSMRDLSPNFNSELIAVYPKSDKWAVSTSLELPFSFQLISNLCYRVLNRKGHGTVNYRAEKCIQLVLSFCILYKGVDDFEEHFQKEAKFTRMIPLYFHQEVPTERFSPLILGELRDLVKSSLLALRAPFESPMVNGLEEFIALANFLQNKSKIDQLQGFFSFGDKKVWESIINDILNRQSSTN